MVRNLGRMAVLLPAGLVLASWLLWTPAGLLGKADAVGYAVCHQIDLRSFHIGVRALPLCSRCMGMYLGVMLSFAYFIARRRGRAAQFPPWPILVCLLLFGAVFAVDGLNSYLHLFPAAPGLYEPSNALRLISGALMGVLLGAVVYPGFNQTVWTTWQEARILTSFADLAGLLGLGAALIGLVLTENPLILYPLALVSTLGVVLLLTVVYTMLLLLVLHRENRAESWGQLVLPLVGGLTLAFVQIGLLDLGRYLITGTWSGFSL